MNAREISHFIDRLMHREVAPAVLAMLTTRDLDDINHYLTGRAKTVLSNLDDSAPVEMVRSYSEAEILAGFGVLG